MEEHSHSDKKEVETDGGAYDDHDDHDEDEDEDDVVEDEEEDVFAQPADCQ